MRNRALILLGMLLYGGIGYAQNIPFGLLKPLFLFNNVQHQLQMTPPLDECFIPNPAFSPRSCATGLFEGEANIFEPYWAQWRVGAQLKDTLLTADEKDEVIKTAVIDSGISKEREAFQQMDVTCEKGADEEEICHGTQVASILCSKDHCSVGEAKNAQMYVYSAKEPLVDGMWDEDVADAIEDAIDHNARVINLSMIYFKSPNTLRIQRLMEKVKSSQVTLVWAAGNDFGQENLYPSNVDNLLSIASLNPYLGSSIFSNQGASTDFAAPSDYNMLSLEGRRFSGTSGAAPVVSGIILNMLKVNPNLTPPQIKNILKASSFDLNSTGFDHQTGWGMPNMVKALLAARYVREGRLNIPSVPVNSAHILKKMRDKVNAEIQKDELVSQKTFDDALSQTKNCDQYEESIKKLFMDYFLTENSSEICKFYEYHHLPLSGLLFCKDEISQERFINQLHQNITHPDPKVREKAVSALGFLKEKKFIPELMDIFNREQDEDVKIAAILALGNFSDDEEAANTLISIFNNSPSHFQTITAKVLSTFKNNPQVIQALVHHVNDEKSAVRETVLTSLGNLKDPQTIPYLMEALHDKLYGTQEVAIDALGNMGSIAVQPILDKLKSLQDHQNRTDEEEITIRGLGKALGLIGQPALNPIIDGIRSRKIYISFQLISATKQIGVLAVEPLVRGLNDSDILVQSYAMEALGSIGDPRAVGPLIQKLKTAPDYLRHTIVYSLKTLKILINDPQVGQHIDQAIRKYE
ncbi:MAG TPA: hypothetical protein DD708_07160 [Deltaproteobacteria bacterium]|nr:hypothetical protein [Deltaproteobacteria bacterium]